LTISPFLLFSGIHGRTFRSTFFRLNPLLKNNDFFTRKLTLGTFIHIKWFDIDPNIRSGVDKGVLDDPEQIYNEMFQKLCMVQTLELEPGNSEVYLAFKKGLAYQINKLN
jgi:hypothetical protein